MVYCLAIGIREYDYGPALAYTQLAATTGAQVKMRTWPRLCHMRLLRYMHSLTSAKSA